MSKKLHGKVKGHRYVGMLGRPHHHLCIFGYDFEDKVVFKRGKGYTLYTSEQLESLWTQKAKKDDNREIIKRAGKRYAKMGFCTVGTVNFQSARYLARYVTKKITGPRADDHYRVVDSETGEITECVPEILRVSNRPGLGKDWYDAFGIDSCHRQDVVHIQGREYRPPTYYDRLLERSSPELAEEIRERRLKFSLAKTDTMSKMQSKEKMLVQSIGQNERSLEEW